MPETTLEDVATRLKELELKVEGLASTKHPKDWRRTVGMFEGSEFMAQVDADILAAREAERAAARESDME